VQYSTLHSTHQCTCVNTTNRAKTHKLENQTRMDVLTSRSSDMPFVRTWTRRLTSASSMLPSFSYRIRFTIQIGEKSISRNSATISKTARENSPKLSRRVRPWRQCKRDKKQNEKGLQSQSSTQHGWQMSAAMASVSVTRNKTKKVFKINPVHNPAVFVPFSVRGPHHVANDTA